MLVFIYIIVFLSQVKSVAEDLGLGFAGMGFDPKWPLEARPHMPKVSKRLKPFGAGERKMFMFPILPRGVILVLW